MTNKIENKQIHRNPEVLKYLTANRIDIDCK